MSGIIVKPPLTDNEDLDRVMLVVYENMIRLEKLLLEVKAVVDAEHP